MATNRLALPSHGRLRAVHDRRPHQSLAYDPPRRLELRAHARPLGVAKVVLELEPSAAGTVISITENPTGIQSVLALFPPLQWLTTMRNLESLARIERLALAGGP